MRPARAPPRPGARLPAGLESADSRDHSRPGRALVGGPARPGPRRSVRGGARPPGRATCSSSRAAALTGDESSWIEIGRRIGRPAVAFSPLRSDLVFYPPVYPYFVGALFRAFSTMRAVLWAQVVLGALLVPVVGRVGALAFGRRVGLLAAAATALYPELLWYPAHYWSETVYLLLLWGAVERTLAADARASRRTAAVAGLLWGLATLTRELSLYLVPIATPSGCSGPGAAASRAPARDLTPAEGSRAAVLVLATVLTVAPWTIRNAIVLPRVHPGLDDGRAQPLAGEHHAHAPADLRGAGHEGRGGRAGPLLPRRWPGETIAARQPRVDPREARGADAGVLEGRQRGARPPRGKGGLRPAAAGTPRADRARSGAAVPGGARPLSRRPRPRPLLRRRVAPAASCWPPTTPPTSSRTPPRASGSRSCRSSSWWRRPWSSGRREGDAPAPAGVAARPSRARSPSWPSRPSLPASRSWRRGALLAGGAVRRLRAVTRGAR